MRVMPLTVGVPHRDCKTMNEAIIHDPLATSELPVRAAGAVALAGEIAMRFHGLMLLRDEDDIIAECLAHLTGWCDAIYLYDLGSTDATWDIVNDLARRDSRIVPFRRMPTIYSEDLRCIPFDHYRDRFESGDWVMKLDADEFYEVPPPRFVKEQVSPWESSIFLQWYFFRLTSSEVAGYETGTSIADDRKRSILERRRFYTVSYYSEPRMFKYRRSMKWPAGVTWPYNMGFPARKRIPIRHYPHRDPWQMEKRYRLRHAMTRLKANVVHWNVLDWRNDVYDDRGGRGGSQRDERAGMASVSGLSDEVLRKWEPGSSLPEFDFTNHLGSRRRRTAQWLVQRVVPILDLGRRGYQKGHQPAEIPPELNEQIGREQLGRSAESVESK